MSPPSEFDRGHDFRSMRAIRIVPSIFYDGDCRPVLFLAIVKPEGMK